VREVARGYNLNHTTIFRPSVHKGAPATVKCASLSSDLF
jgi:hypothetical protein